MKGGSTGKFAIVDVRESDYVGGHIKGCIHIPAGNFQDFLQPLRQKLFDLNVNHVIFHCALSQSRGPSSTLKFLRSLNDLTDDKQIEFFNQLNVWVLEGGFTKWQQAYGTDTSVTEGYDKDIWEFGLN